MLTVQNVKDSLGLAPTDTADNMWLTTVVNGVNSFLNRTRPDITEPWPGSYLLGANLLAQAWYRRRNGADLTGFEEIGGPPPGVLSPEVAMLLGLNRHYHPAIA